MRLGLSLTAGLGLSVTEDSDYQKPKVYPTYWNQTPNLALNNANTESFRFLLTQGALAQAQAGEMRPSRSCCCGVILHRAVH